MMVDKDINIEENENIENDYNNNGDNENEEKNEEVKDDLSEIEIFEKQIEEEKKKSEELNNMLQRTMAEFDNFRKRTIKEKERIYNDAVTDMVKEFLPVLDNLERAMDTFNEKSVDKEVLDGVTMVFNQLQEVFNKLGVEKIESVGEQFDPELHNAVMHIEDETIDDNTVVEEFQKGYKIKDRVIRHSMVKVANWLV